MNIRGAFLAGLLATGIGVMLVAAAEPLPVSADPVAGVEVDGTTLRIRLSGGRSLAGKELEGVTLALLAPGATTPEHIRIEAVVNDPRDPDHEILLYRMKTVDPVTREAHDRCGPDPQGERWAFPVGGQWDAAGRRISDAGFTLTCSDGAQGKCVRLGYKPWKTLRDGTRLADYHQACIWLFTANYCGKGAMTRNGMPLDVYDRIGIQVSRADPAANGLRFEAAWNAEGALCVAHTRVPENETLEQLAVDCPGLSSRLGEAACAEDSTFGAPALLYNRSR